MDFFDPLLNEISLQAVIVTMQFALFRRLIVSLASNGNDTAVLAEDNKKPGNDDEKFYHYLSLSLK
jgi:hypothetical protein